MRMLVAAAVAALAASALGPPSAKGEEILTIEAATTVATAYRLCPDGTLNPSIPVGVLLLYSQQQGISAEKAANELDMLAEIKAASMSREERAMLCIIAGRLDSKYASQ